MCSRHTWTSPTDLKGRSPGCNGKATDPDDIPAEVWKMHISLFNQIVEEDTVPRTWITSTTVPIWKRNGDVNERANYQLDCLLCPTMQIFECAIENHLRNINNITPNQCGFINRSRTTDAIHTARLLMKRHLEKNKLVHLAFLGLEKAFNRVPLELI